MSTKALRNVLILTLVMLLALSNIAYAAALNDEGITNQTIKQEVTAEESDMVEKEAVVEEEEEEEEETSGEDIYMEADAADEILPEEDSADEILSEEVIAEVLADETLAAEGYTISPRGVSYITNFAGLKAALDDPSVTIGVLLGDIQMDRALDINRDITLLSVANSVITSASDSRHFGISSDITIEFSQITLDGGGVSGGISLYDDTNLHLKGAVIQNCYSSLGGAVYAGHSNVIIDNSVITNNRASSGAGIYYASGYYYHTMSVINSEISNNVAEQNGGGIYTYDSFLLELDNTVVSNNSSALNGGGIYRTNFHDINTIITNSYVTGNESGNGGGIYLEEHETGDSNGRFSNSYITDNKALSNGGGICLDGIFGCHISSTEISGNEAYSGGGIYTEVLYTIRAYADVIFADNKADTGYFMTDPADIALHNSIILTTSFTYPFIYGFNNYDISYTEGDPLTYVNINYFLRISDTTPYSTATIFAGQQIGDDNIPTDPSYTELIFIGWVDENNVFYDTGSVVTEDLNLYACWKLA